MADVAYSVHLRVALGIKHDKLTALTLLTMLSTINIAV